MSLQASFRFTFTVIIKTHLKPTADFLVSLDKFPESKHQHVPHTKLHLHKVRQAGLFFAAAVRARNKAARRNKAAGTTAPAQRGPGAAAPSAAVLQRAGKMTSRSVPGNDTVRLTNTSGDYKFPTPCAA